MRAMSGTYQVDRAMLGDGTDDVDLVEFASALQRRCDLAGIAVTIVPVEGDAADNRESDVDIPETVWLAALEATDKAKSIA